jgi:aminoglycoside phosphotransferase (APT) family kinase protein
MRTTGGCSPSSAISGPDVRGNPTGVRSTKGGWPSHVATVTGRVRREGDLVRRPMAFWSPAVHDLLRHLEAVGFPAPRLVGVQGGDELLTWIEGESGSSGWARIVPESGLRRWASFLRRYHDAVAGYRPNAANVWSNGCCWQSPANILCHGDFGPWNGVWQDHQIVGLLDFDHAHPAPRMFDVAYALEYAAPFRDDEHCIRWLAYEEPPDRPRRIQVFCDAYGIAVPSDVVAQVAAQQREVLEHCADLGGRGIEPQAAWIREGYLDTMRARIAWTESLRL